MNDKINKENVENVYKYIVEWLNDYIDSNPVNGFVLGVSGGIDSAVVAGLCAKTNQPVLLVEMPIHQDKDQVNRGREVINWLKDQYSNVDSTEIDLTKTFDTMEEVLRLQGIDNDLFQFTMANTAARLRMTTLYSLAGQKNYVVVGTGNRVEDFGVGFFTKYGDGGVDISPIADLMKSEVYILGEHMGVPFSVMNATPTDGLHADGRTDEDQLGATYDELEWAMEYVDEYTVFEQGCDPWFDDREVFTLSDRQKDVLSIYLSFHEKNKHKMVKIPVCGIPMDVLGDKVELEFKID